MKDIQMIDEGMIFQTSALVDELKRVFDDCPKMLDTLVYVENHEGCWKVKFSDMPAFPVVLHLVSLFETMFALDGLDELTFYAGSAKEKVFTGLAGSFAERGNLLKLLYYVSKVKNK